MNATDWRRVLWMFIGSVLGVFAAHFVLTFFWPSPPRVVSPGSTGITYTEVDSPRGGVPCIVMRDVTPSGVALALSCDWGR